MSIIDPPARSPPCSRRPWPISAATASARAPSAWPAWIWPAPTSTTPDSPSWISHATDTLLRETGDLSILEQVVPYSDKGKGTIWDHNLRAMEFLWADRGAHGLSKLHHGDWNDLIDKAGAKGRGEGVWMSFALARTLKLVGAIAEARGDHALARKCATRYATPATSHPQARLGTATISSTPSTTTACASGPTSPPGAAISSTPNPGPCSPA